MLTYIQGTLASATPLQAVIDVQGLGYEVSIPVTTAERLPAIGTKAKLFTLAVYREDSQALYGFSTAEERDFFRLLVEKVSGVGPRVALSIMSKLSLPMLRSAIAGSDIGLLSKCPGIGKKTAERLVIELKDKVGIGGSSSAGLAGGRDQMPHQSPADAKVQDAVLALVTLGYKPADADKAVRKALAAEGSDISSESLIKAALR
jgi:holliday junction DNA helicase RuvA